MYIAFKWLLGLTLTMWIAMCCIDTLVKKNSAFTEGFNIRPCTLDIPENTTVPLGRKLKLHAEHLKRLGDNSYNFAYLHCFMFVAGALVVSLYNHINGILFITKHEFTNIVTSLNTKNLCEYLKTAGAIVSNYTNTLYNECWEFIKRIAYKSNFVLRIFNIKSFQKQRINLILLKKMKEISEERKNLAQLLLAAIRENRNIRMQYQLENMAKKRLARHIENTEKVIKENRSRYVSFQQLYLVTHQENSFLKSRMKKITKDKEEAEKNLMELMSEVYKSKNNELKSFCSRFIVRTKRNLLNTDVIAEIQKFLHRPQESSSQNWQISDYPDIGLHSANSWLKCSSAADIAEVFHNKTLKPLLSEAPKLKGLPGECVWTVKDKDGLIEKLYECDYESDFDTGDIIKRIREYSVYHDKDCLLDFSNSSNNIEYTSNEVNSQPGTSCSSNTGIDSPLTCQKFLTGSDAFKEFMKSNDNSVISSNILLPRPTFLTD